MGVPTLTYLTLVPSQGRGVITLCAELRITQCHPGSFHNLPKTSKLRRPLDALNLLLWITDNVITGKVHLKQASNWVDIQKEVPCRSFPLYLRQLFPGALLLLVLIVTIRDKETPWGTGHSLTAMHPAGGKNEGFILQSKESLCCGPLSFFQ